MITVTFDDQGQDFLQWDIDGERVVDCRPFQGWLWCKVKLLTPENKIEHGTYLKLELPDGTRMTLKYPVVAIKFH